VKIRKTNPQVDKAGRYTIVAVSEPRNTKFGMALAVTLTNTAGEERLLYVAYSTDPSDQSTLGKLVAAFTDDPALWLKKKLDVTIGADGKRVVNPVGK
jgi:hypothetical protein